MKVVVLVEDKCVENLQEEHGLAFYIEYNDKKYLLDTGASNAFAHNAKKLGISLKEIDMTFLSHSHYDHAGGFPKFFKENSQAVVYLQKEAIVPCYKKVGIAYKYIGIPKGLLENYQRRFQFLDKDTRVDDGVWILQHKTGNLEERGKQMGMYRKIGGKYVPDNFSHEQTVVFSTPDGLVVFNSCCHAGADTIVKEVKKVFPSKKIVALLGGFHLSAYKGTKATESLRPAIVHLGEELIRLEVEKVYTGHCTGMPAFEVLDEILQEKLYYLETGLAITI